MIKGTSNQLISTTKLSARLITDRERLVTHLSNLGWIARDTNNTWKVTALGTRQGGANFENEKGETWPVWPQDLNPFSDDSHISKVLLEVQTKKNFPSKRVLQFQDVRALIDQLEIFHERYLEGDNLQEDGICRLVNQIQENLVTLQKPLSYSQKSEGGNADCKKVDESIYEIIDSLYFIAISTFKVSETKAFRDKVIVLNRMGIHPDQDPSTLQELGDQFGRTRERIRQLEMKSKKHIFSILSSDNNVHTRRIKANIQSILKQNTNEFNPVTFFQSINNVVDKSTASRILPYLLFSAQLEDFSDSYSSSIKDLIALANKKAFEIIKQSDTEEKERLRIEYKDQKLRQKWMELEKRVFFPAKVVRFENGFISEMATRTRDISEFGTGNNGEFESLKMARLVHYESLTELAILELLEKLDNVVWYQEQPIKIPYEYRGKNYFYYPDIAVLLKNRFAFVIEVKPIQYMLNEWVLVKAIYAQKYLGQKGIGFAIIDHKGQTLFDIEENNVNLDAQSEILQGINRNGKIGLSEFKEIMSAHALTQADINVILLKNDLSLSIKPFSIKRLLDGLSYFQLQEKGADNPD
jgi:hypothetical protein